MLFDKNKRNDKNHSSETAPKVTIGDDSLSLIEKLSYDNEGDNLDKLVLADLISRLAPREQKIVYLRYFRDKTQAEVAAELGVSQVQISRLESRIIEKLRENLKN